MTGVQWALEAVLVVLLALTLFHAQRLDRAIRVLRRDRAQLETLLDGFNDSMRLAEEGVERLRLAADGAGRQLSRQIERASSLREDMSYLSDRAERLADTLERGVREARAGAPPRSRAGHEEPRPAPLPATHPGPRSVPPARDEPETRVRSKAERDLLRALHMDR